MTLAIGSGHQPQPDAPIDNIDKTAKSATAAIRDTVSGASPKAANVDAASLSGTGNLLSSVFAASSTDDVRTDKVAALKTAIENGSYTVPAAAVADKLIQNLLG